MQKKFNFETGSKNIFTKKLKILRTPSAPKKSFRCLDFIKIPGKFIKTTFPFKIKYPQDQKARARDYGSYARVRARIFMKFFLVINWYLMSLSFKFCKDPSFCWGDIPLFVTVYDLELKILSFSNPSKNAILSGKKRTLRFIFFKKNFDNNTQKPFIW